MTKVYKQAHKPFGKTLMEPMQLLAFAIGILYFWLAYWLATLD